MIIKSEDSGPTNMAAYEEDADLIEGLTADELKEFGEELQILDPEVTSKLKILLIYSSFAAVFSVLILEAKVIF